VFAAGLLFALIPRGQDYRRVVFTKDGEPRIQRNDYDESGRRVIEWLDFNLVRVDLFEDRDDVPSLNTAYVVPPSSMWTERFAFRLGRNRWGDPRRRQTFWYLLPIDGTIQGYSHPGGDSVGTLGPLGRIETGPGTRFHAPRHSRYRWSGGNADVYPFDHLIADGGSLYGFTGSPSKVAKLWQSADSSIDAIGVVRSWSKKLDTGHVFVRANWKLTVLDHQGTELGSLDLPEALQKPEQVFGAGFTGERIVLSAWQSMDRTLAYSFTPNGALINEWDVLLREPEPFVWWQSPEGITLNLFAPPWVGLTSLALGANWLTGGRAVTWAHYWPLSAICAVIMLVSVTVMWRYLAYRSSRRAQVLWAVAVVLFSWPAYLLCRMTMPLAARINCPDCGRPCSPAADACCHCNATWPTPQRTGLDILLPAQA
jgi:hypothetical protein